MAKRQDAPDAPAPVTPEVPAPAPAPTVVPPTEPKFAVNSVMSYDGIVDGQMQWTFRTMPKIRFPIPTEAQILADAAEHGFKQKFGDKCAIAKNKKTGKSATEAEKHAEMLAEVERLKVPGAPWNATERAPKVDPWLEDLVATVAETPRKLPDGTVAAMGAAAARTYLTGKTDAERVAISRMERYAAKFDAMRAARFAAVDTAAMEKELDGL